MIFATVGTHEQPFPRFVELVLTLAGDMRVVIQHGHTARVTGGDVEWRQWLEPSEVRTLMVEATILVTHAGVGTIVDALRAGHRPIVIPRRRHFREHVDDHQLQIVRELTSLGLVTPWPSEPRPFSTRATRADSWPPSGLKAVVRATALGVSVE